MMTDAPAPFEFHPGVGHVPVLLSVPHAGRHYPASVLSAARVSTHALEALEDRHVDALIGPALEQAAGAIVAVVARAAIDLNRDEGDLDLTMVEGAFPRPTRPGARTRSGLGLLPRRLVQTGELWRRPAPAAAVIARIDMVHRPYHAAIADRLAALAAAEGAALLIDCHSMPPLGPRGAARIVFGTRGGSACDAAIIAAATAAARACGLPHAIDRPYAGGHIVERHGRPMDGMHALQVEIDRTLYLRPDMRTINAEGAARIAAFLARLTAETGHAARATAWPQAAE
ncbi:MAG: N-formylglutamate amidohydrolase [Sphingomonas fennica]